MPSEKVMWGFLDFCACHDWQVAVYQAHPEYLPLYRKLGLYAFKIGEEAILHPQTFTLAGSTMANVRTSCRRAEREGVTLQWYEGAPPQEVMEQLRHLAQMWLKEKGGKQTSEMGFSMGRLDEVIEAAARANAIAEMSGVSQGTILRLVTGAATDRTGQVCAFVTFTPIYGSYASSILGANPLLEMRRASGFVTMAKRS